MVTNESKIDTNVAEWIPGLVEFLRSNGNVEAVLLDHKSQKLSIATLGPVDMEALQAQLEQTLSEISQCTWAPQDHGARIKRIDDQTLIEKPSCATAPRFWRWRTLKWPSSLEKEPKLLHEWQLLSILAATCALLGLSGLYLTQLLGESSIWPKLFYIAAMLAGGWDALKDVVEDVPKGKFDIHFLMLAVAVGASFIGAFGEGALLLFLFSFSGALEHFALYRTRREIHSLFKAAPKVAWVRDATGAERSVSVEAVKVGQVISVRPGDLFPLDGVIVWGRSAADESNLTGESRPIEKGLSDAVLSGTLNLWGSVRVKVTRPVQEGALQKIIRLIQEAQHLKAPSQRFTDRFGTHYTLLILGLTTLMFFIWWLGFGVSPFTNAGDTYSAFYRAMTLLVVSSPCALVLSIPSAILAAIAWGARKGVLFRGGAAIERLAQIDAVALDKTGTLTKGDLMVVEVESFPSGQEETVLQLAYSVEKNANHPIAQAIIRHAESKGVQAQELSDFKSITGMGLQARFDEEACVVGRRELLEMGPLSDWVKALPEPSADYAEVWVVYRNLLGRILLKDEIRRTSAAVLDKIHAAGLRTCMLTGDHRKSAESVAQELGLQEVRYGLKPEEKVAAIQEMAQSGQKVAMLGDGVNDAPSLAASYVSVAMGSRGADAALEQSEVILMHDKIERFWDAYELSQRARRVIRQNLVISLGTIVVMVGASFTGLVPISLGVLAHEGSTVLVCLNSLRLLFTGSVWASEDEEIH